MAASEIPWTDKMINDAFDKVHDRPQVASLTVVVKAFEIALQLLHSNCDFVEDRERLMRIARELMDVHQPASGILCEVIAAALDAKEL